MLAWSQKGEISEVKPQKNTASGGVRAGRRLLSSGFPEVGPDKWRRMSSVLSGRRSSPRKASHRDLGVPQLPRNRCPLAGMEMQKTGRTGMPPAGATSQQSSVRPAPGHSTQLSH